MTTKNNITINKWYDYNFPISNQILLPTHIEFAVKNLYLDILDQIDTGNKDKTIRILFKVQISKDIVRSISYVQTVKLSEMTKLIEIFKAFWNLKAHNYNILAVESIVLVYKVLEGKEETKLVNHRKLTDSNKSQFNFGGFDLPCTMDITKWSKNHKFSDDYTKAIVYIKNLEFHVSLFDKYQSIQVKLGESVLLEFSDTLDNAGELSTFSRKLKNQIYFFVNGELVVKQIDRKVKFLKKLDKDSSFTKKFITMDLETRTIDGKMIPYCISFFYKDIDGLNRTQSHYLRDGDNPDSLLKHAINNLLSEKLDGYVVYLHNFSNFDAVFLLRILSDMGKNFKLRPVIRDGRIINLSLDYKDNFTKYSLSFRDSYQLLPSSLKDLAKNFNIGLEKGIYPYKFVNNNNVKLNYEGAIPDFKYFDGITLEQYNEYCKNRFLFNLKHETEYYCELDCFVLYNIIEVFGDKMFQMFNIDILKYSTLPSLAYAIYRSNFMKKEFNIPLIDGSTYTDLKKAYTGGMVDVYKPTSIGKVFSYDVNSLYPFTMKRYPMPIGTPKYFTGDIFKINSDAFGIFEVEVVAPDNLFYPVLQTKVKSDNVNQTISPLGKWTGWYLSEELKNAMKFGYKFKVISGYLFDKKYIFNEYVDFLYNLKSTSVKGTPDYVISKLLMNSLYGKFGAVAPWLRPPFNGNT